MGADQNFDWQQAVASALDWWRDAGVDATIDEAPRNWLARPALAAPTLTPADTKDAVVAAPALRDTLDAFTAWRNGPDAPEACWPGKMLPAQGDPVAGLMILIDMPDRDDLDALLSGPAGRLFDRMLAAIGRDRQSVYLTALCTARPVSGRIAPEIEERLGEIARHHVALTAPKRLLLLGNAPSRALLGADAARARGGLRGVKLSGGTVAAEVETEAVASFHPRFLLEKPAYKAEAWKDLQMLIGGFGS